MRYICRGDEVLVDGEWYPVVGFSLMHKPNGPTTGSVFTDKPIGAFEHCLGYRLEYSKITDVREREQ
ncbi:hypothetical protein GCM10011499_14540 [Pelagibacterium lentulum]|uniref:Uncharacterized protein n=2 Tax=Pelagibacterium lentulum TaxID=2029865 RepID=A0A916RAN6_9HYPH|nr:hypothetical protein GCM10011499_14540 [Pelagibacterium lentulum]